MWCLARVDADFRITGTDDTHQTYLLFTSSHDGRSAAQALLTTVRVVCQNTLNAALSADGQSGIRIRHTRSAQAKLEQARKLISVTTQTVRSLQTKLDELATRRMRKENMLAVINRLFPSSQQQEVPKKTENLITEILSLYESNDGDAIPEIRGTAYNLLNAITEHTDHERSVKETKARHE